MEVIYNILILGAGLTMPAVVIGLAKPDIYKKPLKQFATRKHILLGGILLFFLMGSLGAAAEPASIKQARKERERIAVERKENEEKDRRAQEENNKKARLKAEEDARSRVTTKEKTETESVPFTEETHSDSNLAKGSTKVVQEGSNGEIARTYTYTYKGGQEQSKVLKEERVVKAPTNKITSVGTYIYVAPKPAAPKAPTVITPSSGGAVKLSRTGICHAPGTTYYNQTTHYTGFPSLQACLNAGGRMPKR